ncbi:MAG: hypothetical protein ACLRWQ_02220 [Flavonifractor plautii]
MHRSQHRRDLPHPGSGRYPDPGPVRAGAPRLLPQRGQGHLLPHRLPGHPGLPYPERHRHRRRRSPPPRL